jgi:REP element-mobilizing transposase RayT
MHEPLAYFLTWVTYGTWLPGDARGSLAYKRGWQPPDPIREESAAESMTEGECRLSPKQRTAVEQQIAETCRFRGWELLAVSCRSNHVHAVVAAAGADGFKVRDDLKAWGTLCLKERFDPTRKKWWAERGDVTHLYNEESIESAIGYVVEEQDHKTAPTPPAT